MEKLSRLALIMILVLYVLALKCFREDVHLYRSEMVCIQRTFHIQFTKMGQEDFHLSLDTSYK
jgi:hypothetical protein